MVKASSSTTTNKTMMMITKNSSILILVLISFFIFYTFNNNFNNSTCQCNNNNNKKQEDDTSTVNSSLRQTFTTTTTKSTDNNNNNNKEKEATTSTFSTSSSSVSENDEQILYKEIAIKLRRIAGETHCKSITNPNQNVGPTGGFCLEPNPAEDWGNRGKAAKNHLPADPELAYTIATYITTKFNYPTDNKKKNEKISVYDIGAGVGQYGYFFKNNNSNIEWAGFDGAENIESFTDGYVKWIDVTEPLFDTIPDNPKADWVMSLEIGEHIPPESTDTMLNLLDQHNRYGIILSWAIPGQDGHSHINLRSNEDIINKMQQRGYIQDTWTAEFQNEGRTKCHFPWFQKTFMVFKRQNPIIE